MKKLKKINQFTIALMVLCFCAFPAAADNLIVDGNSVTEDYQTIQAAVDDAVSGDIITVKAATYSENVKISGKSLDFVAEEDVILTVPVPDIFTDAGYAEWDEDLPEMTSPVVSVDIGSKNNVQISFTGFDFVAPDPETAQEGYLVSAGIFAGAGTSLTVSDCGFNGAFMVPVLVTTYEDVFNDMVFDDFGTRSVSDSTPASLDISGCTMENYVLAGVSLVGPNVTGVIADNSFTGMVEMEDLLDEFGPAMAVDSFRSAFASGTLFSRGLDAHAERPGFMTGAGVLLLNSSDGESEDVTLTGNTITKNLLGIGILKDFRVVDELEDAKEEDPILATVISHNTSINENLVGIAVIGGFNEPLVWSRDHGITIDDFEDWDFSGKYRTYVEITDEQHIVGNMVGVILLGGVKAQVDSCAFTDNFLAGLVALGDLEGSVISNNEFSGTVGVNLLYGLGSSFWNMFAPKGAIEMEYAVSITGNSFIGNGLIEGAHEYIMDYVSDGEGEPLSVLSSMGTRIASGGPLAFLPSGMSFTQQEDEEENYPTLAGIVLLDGASEVKIEDNVVTDSLLGVTAMDLGLDHILYEISEGDIKLRVESGISDVLIQNNEISGNLSGLNLLGARELIGTIIEEEFGEESLSSSIRYYGGLENFAVRANTITGNHIGVINGLNVQGLKFSGNSVDNNLVLGMLNAGMGAWAFDEVFDYSDFYGGPIPSAEIFGNSFSFNGTVDGDLDDLPVGTETFGTYVKGGVAVFDVPDYSLAAGELAGAYLPSGISLNRNNIQGNGNYGLLVVGRVGELRYTSTELVSTDFYFDATENFWGDVTGPSSYFGEDSEVIFTDPVTAESADKAGDAISGVVFEEDGQYYPYDFMRTALYVRPLNCILFDEWLGDDGEDVQAVVGAKVSGGEESRVGRDLGNGNRVDTTVKAGENGFDWTLTRLGSKPADSSALKVSAGGYYRFDVTSTGNVKEVTLKFGYSSSSAPDFYWYDRTAGEWIELVPSASGKGYLEFIFNGESNPTLNQLFSSLNEEDFDSSGPATDPGSALFAQSKTSESSGGGSGGCNVAYGGLPAMALLLPLLALMLKK